MTTRPMSVASFAVILVFSGFMNALQARSNGELSQHIGNGVQAALISFSVGFVLLCIAVIVSSSIRAGLRRVIPAVRAGHLPWWALPTGLIGGLFIACQSFSVALIGVAMFSVGMVAGQTVNSLLVDRLGLSPIRKAPIVGRRVAAAGLATIAVAIAVSGRVSTTGLSVPAMLLAVFAGCLVAVQQALNGRVNMATVQPISTTWLNFLFGTAGLLVGAVLGIVFFGAQLRMPTSGPWWMYLGGVFGLVFIVTASWAVPRYGVLLFALVTIAGQLTAALVLDLIAPVGSTGLQWTLVLGVVITFAAVALSAAQAR